MNEELKDNHFGYIDISLERLAAIMQLPVGMKIEYISAHYRFDKDVLTMKVSHPALPDAREQGAVEVVQEYNEAPLVSGAYTEPGVWYYNQPVTPDTVKIYPDGVD